jgi:signal transduction histidine kinase
MREQEFLFTSIFVLIFGLVTTGFNIFYSVVHGYYLESIVSFVTFIILLIAVFGKSISRDFRIGLIILFLYTNGVVLIARWGLLSSGQFFLFLIPVITAIYRIKNGTIVFLIINALTFVYLRILVNMEILNSPELLKFGLYDWIVFAVGFVIINILVAIFIYYLVNMLFAEIDTDEEEISNLSTEMEKLNRVNLKFQKIIEENKDYKNNEIQIARLESVGRLTTGIAHEFNNFITVIIGYTDILLSISGKDEMYNKLLKKIRIAGRAAESLVVKLLAFSKNLVMRDRIVNLNDILLELKEPLKDKLSENINLDIQLPDENYLIKIDPKQLENLITELVVNSSHAIQNEGNIIISLDTTLLNSQYVKDHDLNDPGEYVVLTIEDDGVGMDDYTLSHIFEPFFSTKAKAEYLGLGLSVIYGIVKQSGGDIIVSSKPGKGTKMALYFKSRQEKLAFKKDDKIIPTDLKGNEKILLVEDDKLVRSVIVEVLTNYGYRMVTASNGVDGLETFQKVGDSIDLVIADVVMPKMSGIELVKEIEKLNENIRVLFMSGYSEQVNNLEDMGVNYIKKPFVPLDLVKKIRYVLDMKPILPE